MNEPVITKKFYTVDGKHILFVCEKCGKNTELRTEKFLNKHRVKLRCTCKQLYHIEVDYRVSYRKLVNLNGNYSTKKDIIFDKTTCIIKNLSMHGLCFESLERHDCTVGDYQTIVFQLDNKRGSILSKQVMILHVSARNTVGCTFIDRGNATANKELFYYLK